MERLNNNLVKIINIIYVTFTTFCFIASILILLYGDILLACLSILPWIITTTVLIVAIKSYKIPHQCLIFYKADKTTLYVVSFIAFLGGCSNLAIVRLMFNESLLFDLKFIILSLFTGLSAGLSSYFINTKSLKKSNLNN